MGRCTKVSNSQPAPISGDVIKQILYLETPGNNSRHVDKCCTVGLGTSRIWSLCCCTIKIMIFVYIYFAVNFHCGFLMHDNFKLTIILVSTTENMLGAKVLGTLVLRYSSYDFSVLVGTQYRVLVLVLLLKYFSK